MSKITPVLPALSFPNRSSKGARLLAAGCPFCEKTHYHGDPHDLAVGAITHRVAHCLNASVSPLYGHEYGLQIVKISGANDEDTLAPRRGNRKPLHAKLAKFAPRLRRETRRVIMGPSATKVGFKVVKIGDSLKLTANELGEWLLLNLREASVPKWKPKPAATGSDFASLAAFLTGTTIDLIIEDFVRALNFDAPTDFVKGVAGIVQRWQARLAADGLAASTGHSGYAACFDRPSDYLHYAARAAGHAAAVISPRADQSEFARFAPSEHIARTYDLPSGVVAYRLIESAWAVTFDATAAAEFMHLPDPLTVGGPGVGERIHRMFIQRPTADAVNDNPPSSRTGRIGGEA